MQRSSGLEFLSVFVQASVQPTITFDRSATNGAARFVYEGRVCWSISFWQCAGELEGFCIVDEDSGVEVVVRDLTRLGSEPLLASFAARLARDTGLSLPR
jgi:hypothetical protein